MPIRTGIVRNDLYLQHLAGIPHVESPKRLKVLYDMLNNDTGNEFISVPPRPASHDELLLAHTESHILRIAATAGVKHSQLDSDTSTTPLSYEAAILAVGGTCALVDAIIEGQINNGFALIRPPGHHAERDTPMGFCLFNNVAVAAKYAINKYGLSKIAIIDWDLHHGNGTQSIFYDDPSVLFISTHQFPCYPGSGSLIEAGSGKGLGYTVNVPLTPGCSDGDFFQVFNRVVVPVVDSFQPDFLFVSAGFDIYAQDPLGGMKVTPKGFASLTRIMMELAHRCCNGRLALALEGGYHLVGLCESVNAVLKELHGQSMLSQADLSTLEKWTVPYVVKKVIEVQQAYWPAIKKLD